MRFAGTMPVDAPDPSEKLREKVAGLGFGVAGLSQQPHLEDWGALGLVEQWQGAGENAQIQHASVSRSYTLWRNPRDRDDPVNLLELDEMTRQSLDDIPPWPRPEWLLRQVERMRYPMLWEAVQTHWSAPVVTALPTSDQLVDHVQHVLNNHFRSEHALPPMTGQTWAQLVTIRGVQHDHPVVVDSVERSGVLLDMDPYVVGIGVGLDDGRVLTAAIPRVALPLLQIAFLSGAPLISATDSR
jgi:hypothetical protein